MAEANLAARFLLELAAVAALAWSGYHATDESLLRWLAAVAVPVVLVVIWAFVVAPKADNPIPQTTRMLIGSALLLVTAGALSLTGQPVAAIVFAALVVLNTVVLLATGA